MNARLIYMSGSKKILKAIARRTPPTRQIVLKYENLIQENENLKQQLGNTRLPVDEIRTLLSHKFVHGSGLEIGALHMPLPVLSGVKVSYVDYISVDGLRKHYPELQDLPLVNVDIVDNGERLSKVRSSSVDFIIANHFIEHCQDPIGTIITFYKKLRPAGILYMAVPDKRYTFDMHRPLTPYSHLLEEHKIYPSKKFYRQHMRETARLGELVVGQKRINERVQELVDMNYSIHHHVWTQIEMVELFYETANRFALDIEVEAIVNNIHEVVFIVRKRDPKYEARRVKDIANQYFGNRRP